MELQFVHSLWMVYLADRISLCSPLKRVFYRQNALEGKWHTGKVADEEKEQNSEAEMPDFRQSGHRQFFLYHDVIKHALQSNL